MRNETLEKQLFEKHKYLINAIIRSYDGIAEKNLEEVATNALRSAIKTKLAEMSPAYAATCIRNAISSYVRDKQISVVVSLSDVITDYQDGTVETIEQHVADETPSPEELSAISESLELADKILNKFPEPFRTILQRRWLHLYYGFPSPASFTEISAELPYHLTPKTVERRYQAALEFIGRVKTFGGAMKTKSLNRRQDKWNL